MWARSLDTAIGQHLEQAFVVLLGSACSLHVSCLRVVVVEVRSVVVCCLGVVVPSYTSQEEGGDEAKAHVKYL